MLPLPRSPEAFLNVTAVAPGCVWSGPQAADAPGHLSTSSAQGIAVQAAWFGTLAVFARWTVKAVQAIELIPITAERKKDLILAKDQEMVLQKLGF